MQRCKLLVISIFLFFWQPCALAAVHPELLMRDSEVEEIRRAIELSPEWKSVQDAIISECDVMLRKRPLFVTETNNVLRDGLKRIFFLSYAYRTTGRSEYADKAVAEMMSLCSADKWRGEYLGIAELTFGVGIGYDWLYDRLSEDQRKFVADAVVRLGIEPSFGPDGAHFLKSVSNWNLVCNTGMAVGALAVEDRYPELSDRVLKRTLNSLYMAQYAPDGAYAEGYGYWGYGTGNIVCLIDVLDKKFGNDFGLSDRTGFLRTGEYILNMVGPSGCCFNYSDTKPETIFNPAMFWFARKTNDYSILYNEKQYIQSGRQKRYASYRMAPLALIWGAGVDFASVVRPSAKSYHADGVTPVDVVRSGWDRDDIYVAIKGGTPLAGHAHMDVGSFVLDADGERWVTDLGSPMYGSGYFTLKDADSLEKSLVLKPGMEYLKVTTTDSPRWSFPLAGPFLHNLITVDSSLVNVRARADFRPDRSLDLSTMYAGKLTSYIRKAEISGEACAVILDSLRASGSDVSIRWAVLTDAEIDITGQGSAILRKNGKVMNVFVDSSIPGHLYVTEGGVAPRKGGFTGKCSLLCYKVALPAGSSLIIRAKFTPGSRAPQSGNVKETVLACRTVGGTEGWWNSRGGINALRPAPPVRGMELRYLDINGDGRPDVLRTMTADGTPIQWIDDNGNMTVYDLEGDMSDDCLLVDRNRDGVFGSYGDLCVDWVDTDSDGKADIQIVVDNIPYEKRNTSGGGHYMMVFDLDKDNVFNHIDWRDYSLRCWWHDGLADFYTDYHGNSEFLKVHSTPERLNDVSLNWENPFLFLDEDRDGLTEMTVRLCDSRFNHIGNPGGKTNFSGRINWAAISVDLDNDNNAENPLDLDFTVCFRSKDGSPYGKYEHFYKGMRGNEAADGYFLDPCWRRNSRLVFPEGRQVFDFIFKQASWESVCLTFDEDDDCKRWERVELYSPGDIYRFGPGNGGLDDNRQSDVAGDRGEWDMDNSGAGKLYVSPLDGRIHLYGAEWGAWRIDQTALYYQGMGGIYDLYGPGRLQGLPSSVAVVKYEDADGNGFFDTMRFDWDGDGTFEEVRTASDLGVKDESEVYDISRFKYGDYTRLFKSVSDRMWKGAEAKIRKAESLGLNTGWYSVYMNPKSQWQKYHDGYWLDTYLEKDINDYYEKTK